MGIALERLFDVTGCMLEALGEVTLQQVHLLLFVMTHDGCPQGDISGAIGMPDPTVSRNINKLGARAIKYKDINGHPKERPGLHLLEKRPDQQWDTRRNLVWLTHEGRLLRERIRKIGEE